jgi:shikimate kinase
MKHVVVATGGGSILAVSNRVLMKERGFIVCLDAQPETIAARLRDWGRHQSERPLLGDDEPLARIIELKSARQALYEEADLVIATDNLTPDQCTHAILTAFRERSAVTNRTP